jgi:hypothetical protein
LHSTPAAGDAGSSQQYRQAAHRLAQSYRVTDPAAGSEMKPIFRKPARCIV